MEGTERGQRGKGQERGGEKRRIDHRGEIGQNTSWWKERKQTNQGKKMGSRE